MLRKMFIVGNVEETFDDFLNSKRANGCKSKTLQTYSQHFNAISKDLAVEKQIDELSKRDLELLVIKLQERGLSPKSIKSYLATLSSFFSWCKEEGLCDIVLKPYKAPEAVKDTYTNEELVKLLKKPNRDCGFAQYRNWVIINLLLNSGCRASTIRNMLVKDLNLEEGSIRYRHTKNGSVQIVPLCQEMRKILKEYLRTRGNEPDSYLFPTEDDAQMTENGLNEAIRRYNRSRGVEKTSIHLFRHSFAERYLKAGGSAFNLQRLLGHSTLTMTKHYCRIYDTELVENYDQFSPLQNLYK